MHVHLVLVTRYRKKVLDGKAVEILRESFGGICRKSAAELIETNGAEDPVPLLRFLSAQGGRLCPGEQV
jgi:putative transposase